MRALISFTLQTKFGTNMRRTHLFSDLLLLHGYILWNIWANSCSQAVKRDLLVAYPLIDICGNMDSMSYSAVSS